MPSWLNWRRRAPDPQAEAEIADARTDAANARLQRDAALSDRTFADRTLADRSLADAELADPAYAEPIAGRHAARVVRDAYERGRRDERARRRPGLSLVSLAVVMAAVVGGGALYLAAREGSFAQGGAVVDHSLSNAGAKAQAPLRGAADQAGSALEHAGQDIKDKAGTGDQAANSASSPAQ